MGLRIPEGEEIMIGESEVDAIGGRKIPSEPPQGKCKVVNLYVDPITKRLTVQYDSTPT